MSNFFPEMDDSLVVDSNPEQEVEDIPRILLVTRNGYYIGDDIGAIERIESMEFDEDEIVKAHDFIAVGEIGTTLQITNILLAILKPI